MRYGKGMEPQRPETKRPAARPPQNRRPAASRSAPAPKKAARPVPSKPGRTQREHPMPPERQQIIQNTVKKRKKRRRKSYILYYILIGVILSVTGVVLSLTVFFNVETITVEGNQSIQREEIIAASGVKTGDNLLRLNVNRAGQSVIGAFVNLDQVTIERNFPSGLTIRVEEAQVEAVIRSDGQYFALSQGGRIVGIGEKNQWPGVPEVVGCDYTGIGLGDYLVSEAQNSREKTVVANDANKYTTLEAVLNAIEANTMKNINYIDLNDITTIRLYYQERMEIKFGSITNLDYELSCVKEIIQKETLDDGYYIIDDTLANGKYYLSQPESLELPLADAKGDSKPGGGTDLSGKTGSSDPQQSSEPAGSDTSSDPASQGDETSSRGQASAAPQA